MRKLGPWEGAFMLSHFSLVSHKCNPWTVAHHAPLPMEFSRQEYWTGLPCPPPVDLPEPGFEPASLVSPALQVGSLPLAPPGRPRECDLFKFSVLPRGRESLWGPPCTSKSQCSYSSKHSPQKASAGPSGEWASGVSLAWETLRWSKADLSITADFLRRQYTTILHKVDVSHFRS